MTTNYHTPLSTTERLPATGGTINAPLGELDEAVTDAFDRANHTGTQLPETISPQGEDSGLDADTVRGLTPTEIGELATGVSRSAAKLTWIADDEYTIAGGAMPVSGTQLAWEDQTRDELTLSANTVYYVYLYNDDGDAAFEESTTLPVWNDQNDYYIKTGDATRRWVNWFATDDDGDIRRFFNTCNGRESETIFVDGQDIAGSKRALTYGTRDDDWITFNFETLAPYFATHWLAVPNVILPDALNDAILGLSPIDLGAALADQAPYHYRARSQVASGVVSPGGFWLLMPATPEYYYRIRNMVGASGASVEAHGARIVR